MNTVAATAPYPDKCPHLLFEEQADRAPDSPALIMVENRRENRRLSYGELNLLANQFARRLQRLGIGRDALVGIFLESSPEAVVALLAVLKAGAAFVPLDPGEPPARLTYVIQNARLRAVVTNSALKTLVPNGVEAVCVDSPGCTAEDGENTPISATLEDAACVLYTSGSTGRPKGVVRTHRGIVSRLAWTAARSDDIFLHNMPLGAGFSEERLFLPLMQGLPLVMMPEEQFNDLSYLAAVVEGTGVTNLTLAPVSLRRLLDLDPGAIRRLRNLRALAVGGAELPGDLIEGFRSAVPDTQLINAYGSTEAGSVIRGPMSRNHGVGPSSIGRPVANAKVLILDREMQIVADGEVGEMYIGAPSLAREYLFLPELTSERFVANPHSQNSAERLYRTGDLGRYLPNGEIEFHGRTDRQVKVRGFRVELREVEVALEQHAEVREAVVVRVQKPEREGRLIAYFATKMGAPVTVGQVRAHLQRRLPDYMVPALFVQLRDLPRTHGGKVDVRALPGPEAMRPLLEVPYEAPRNAMEEKIAGIWEDVLELSGIGVRDNFVELGGDSLSAARVSVEMIERFDVEVPPDFLFDPGTVAAVAEFVSHARSAADGYLVSK